MFLFFMLLHKEAGRSAAGETPLHRHVVLWPWASIGATSFVHYVELGNILSWNPCSTIALFYHLHLIVVKPLTKLIVGIWAC